MAFSVPNNLIVTLESVLGNETVGNSTPTFINFCNLLLTYKRAHLVLGFPLEFCHAFPFTLRLAYFYKG